MITDLPLYSFMEWDKASFDRKCAQAWCVFREKDTEELTTNYVYECLIHDDENVVFKVKEGYGSLRNHMPVYYNPPAGWYTINGNGLALIKKLRKKTFTIGVCVNSHSFDYIHEDKFYPIGQVVSLDLVNEPEINHEKAIDDEGLLSKQIYLGKEKIFLLDTMIGFRNKTNIMIDGRFATEMNDLFMRVKLNPKYKDLVIS